MRYKHPIHKNYECDEQGNIYSFCNNRWGFLKESKKIHPMLSRRGYYVIRCQGERIYAHKFIMECKLGKQLNLGVGLGQLTINHKNENKLDNSISNLELLECGENTRHSLSKYKNPRYIHFNKVTRKYVVARRVAGKLSNYCYGTLEQCEAKIKELGW